MVVDALTLSRMGDSKKRLKERLLVAEYRFVERSPARSSLATPISPLHMLID